MGPVTAIANVPEEDERGRDPEPIAKLDANHYLAALVMLGIMVIIATCTLRPSA